MALGRNYELCERLPGKGKKAEWRNINIVVGFMRNGVMRYQTDSVAHFVARLFSDRAVKIEKSEFSKSSFTWVLIDGRTGFQLCFDAPAESVVRARMAEASVLKVPSGLDAVEAAKQRILLIQQKEERVIVEGRVAEKRWPPPEGSMAARVLELASGGENFESCRKLSNSSEWTNSKKSSAAALITKLKGRSLSIVDVEEHAHDSYTGARMNLAPGQAWIVVNFCALDDAKGVPSSSYDWLAKVKKPSAPKKPSRGKSKPEG